MEAEERKPKEKPSPAECPRRFCFFWLEKGSRFAEGLYDSLQKAIKHAAFMQDDLCGCTFGVCKRLDPVNGKKDWHEPNDLELEKAGLPLFYFIAAPESVDIESREEYIRDSETLWGEEHWKK